MYRLLTTNVIFLLRGVCKLGFGIKDMLLSKKNFNLGSNFEEKKQPIHIPNFPRKISILVQIFQKKKSNPFTYQIL